MNRILAPAIIFLLFLSLSLYAQKAVNYNDVGVIVNMNDTTSQAIAAYFKAKRNIPDVNMIPVHTTSVEEINDSTFKDLISQIQNYLDSNNLVTKLNYLVTTKGCPLKVLRDSTDPNGCNSSVESELMLLTPANSSQIGACIPYDSIQTGRFFSNPYYGQTKGFSYSLFNIYLVTRLDAYTEQEVFNLIDRSGPNTYVNKDSVLFVFDQSPAHSGDYYNSGFGTEDTLLTARGWKVLLNRDSIYLTNQHDVLGYMSWGSNDGYSQDYTLNAIPHNTWANGSIAETLVSTSGRSFEPGTTYGQSLIADLLDEGVTGAKGYVYEPLEVAIADPKILFTLYTDMNPQGIPVYNLAESYFSASYMIGWMDVVVGDPKTSITTDLSLANGINKASILPFQLFPNPAQKIIYIRANLPGSGTMKLQVFDNLGRLVMQEEFPYNESFIHSINTESLSTGIYTVRLLSGDEILSSKFSVLK